MVRPAPVAPHGFSPRASLSLSRVVAEAGFSMGCFWEASVKSPPFEESGRRPGKHAGDTPIGPIVANGAARPVPPNHPGIRAKSAVKTPDISVGARSAAGVPDIICLQDTGCG